MYQALRTFFGFQLKRHTNNPTLWLMILIAPIAAKFMVPLHSDNYSVLAINNAYPVLTPSVIGLELGIISALLLTPLVYIFLRTARINRTPWQIEEVTPSRRVALHLGHWLADTLVVWLLIFSLAISGVVLSFFRLPVAQINILETMISCMLVACPAFAFMAALRLLFSARPKLRGAASDGLFFVFWMTGIVTGSLVMQSESGPMMDLFGYASPVALAMDEPVDVFSVGASPATSAFLHLDAWRGVVHGDYLLSRVIWLAIAMTMVLLSSLLYQPVIPKVRKGPPRFKGLSVLSVRLVALQKPMLSNAFAFAPLVQSNVQQLFKTGWLLPLLLIAGIAGFVLPFRSITGPLLWLLLLFPYSHQAVRWQKASLPTFLSTLPMGRLKSQLQLLWALVLPLAFFCLPSIISVVMSGEFDDLADVAFIVVEVPGITLVLSNLSRSSFALRLPLLMMWYIYFNFS